jgi:glycosyltransferase involved in cell wall biosynthesis
MQKYYCILSLMKVLVLNFERTWRGGERQTLYNMHGFRNAGLHVELLCRKGFLLGQKARQDDFTVHSFNNIGGVTRFLMRKGGEYDVLHAQTSHILTYCILTKPFHKTKIVVTRRVIFAPRGFFSKLKYRYTDKVIAVSNAVRSVLMHSRINNVAVVSDIVTQRIVDRQRAERLLEDVGAGNRRVIGTIAVMSPDKDPLNMVEAIYHLSKQRNDFVFLHFGFGELEEEVKTMIAQYHLGQVYKPIGYREHVEDYFSILDLFVMSSKYEGLGSSVLDAFMLKVPVVATNAGGMAELLNDGRGISCSTADPVLLSNAINIALNRSTAATQIALDAACEYVSSHHTIERITNRYLEVFREIS